MMPDSFDLAAPGSSAIRAVLPGRSMEFHAKNRLHGPVRSPQRLPASTATVGTETYETSEFDYPVDTTLMSTTDTTSRITYANAAFVNVSGFARDQMLGRPHNIVRHPDMPKAVFADLWSTLKKGDTWTAVLKNRRANGTEHYWVQANITPVRRGDAIVGYMSVRTHPTRAEIDAAQALYRRFQNGRARGFAFHKGLIVRTGLLAWTSIEQVLPLRWRLRLAVGAVAASGLIVPLSAAGRASIGVLGVIAVALLVEVWLERRIARPLDEILAQAKAVASGRTEVNARMNRVDAIGMIQRAVNQSGLNLRSLINDISTGVQEMQGDMQRLATGNDDLAQHTQGTSAHLQDTAEAAAKMVDILAHRTRDANTAHTLADQADQAVDRGERTIVQVVRSMQAVASMNAKILDINEMVDNIAFQTNILALNAAIEAARAGATGRGFAVVAGEVRHLAQRSTDAARQIAALLRNTHDESQNSLQEAERAGKEMHAIVAKVGQLRELITRISTGAGEQSDRITQVSTAVAQIDRLTQEDAHRLESATRSQQNLLMRMERLVEAAQVFRRSRH